MYNWRRVLMNTIIHKVESQYTDIHEILEEQKLAEFDQSLAAEH